MKYYFDTSIWLDLFENREEYNLPKGKLVQELVNKIIKDNEVIIFTELVINEIKKIGYSDFEIESLFKQFDKILINIEPSKKGEIKIPNADALHALIARNNKAVLVTRDYHFQKLLDIIKPKKPEEIT